MPERTPRVDSAKVNRASEEERFMSNQVVLITGALTGIRRATAVAFAKEKATVVISGRHTDEGQKLAAELRTLGANAQFVQADVRHESDIQNLVDHTVLGSASSMWPSTTLVPRVSPDLSPTKPPKLTPRHSTRMFSEHC